MKSSEITRFGAFELDPANRRLAHAGREVSMPSRAFDVLVTLVERRGTVVSKETLLTAVWADVAVEDNTLVQAVSALRRVLREASGGDHLVLTIPGKGYQFAGRVRRQPSISPVGLAAAAMLAITLAAVAWRAPHRFHVGEDHCVAVIPFESIGAPSMSGTALADGLVARLAAADRLRVRPTLSILDLKAGDYRRLGAQLKVDRLVGGTIHATGQGIRVTVQIIDVNREAAIWAQSFDDPDAGAEPSDRLVGRIANALRARVFF